MKLITKWFTMFTLLLVACVTSVYAQEEEKVYATFENPTGITWDAESMTFSWDSPWGNQLHNIGLPNGNITAYEKLVIDCEILSGDGYRFMFYATTKGTTAGGLTIITESGKHEYKLSEFDMDADYLTQCSEICLSGYNGSGQVKVNEVYLVKSADPLAGAKELLTNAITVGKMKSAIGKTPESFAALTQAISDGEAALVDAEATAESLATAKGDIEAAIEGLEMQAGYSVLTAGMFKHYASIEEPGEGSAVSGAFELCKASDLPFGDGNVSELNWADLTDYDKLIVITSGETKPRFCMNRLVANGQQAETQEDSKMLDINPNNDYTWSTDAYQTIEGNIYEIDLKKIVDDYTFARLHCIKKQGWGAGVIVTEIILYKEEDVPEFLSCDFEGEAESNATGIRTYNKDIKGEEVAQMQAITGWTIAENGDARAAGIFAYGSESFLGGEGYVAPAAKHAFEEGAAKALGLVGVWNANLQYTLDAPLEPGKYLLQVPVYNAGGASAVSANKIGADGTFADTKEFPVDQWTVLNVEFTVESAKDVTLSLGYAAANSGSAAMPHLFLESASLYSGDEAISAAKTMAEARCAALNAVIALDKAKEAKLAALNALVPGEGLFQYDAQAINLAKEAVVLAETLEAVEAVAMPTPTKPDPEKQYTFQLKEGGKYMAVNEGIKLADKAYPFSFVAVEGGWALKNGDSYVAFTGTGNNNWSMGATADPYAWAISALGEGYYTLAKASKTSEYIGVDNTGAGSSCYANKGVSDKSTWTIAEYIAPVLYTVSISNEIENGTVAAEPASAEAGTKIQLTATPAEGYQLISYDVRGVEVNEVILVAEDGTFVMPAFDVSVSATFVEAAPILITLKASEGAYAEGGDYVKEWTSNTTPIVKVTAGANNMYTQFTETFQWYSGKAGSSIYTISAPINYIITSCTITAKGNSAEQTITAGEAEKTFGTADFDELVLSNLSNPSTSFTLTGANSGLLIQKIELDIAPNPNFNISNDKAYLLTTPRGSLGVSDGQLVATSKEEFTASNFAIISYNDAYYLWSVEAGRFILDTGEASNYAPTPINLVALDGGKFQLRYGNNAINISSGYAPGLIINNWTTVDEGNAYTIEAAADFDATDALAILATPITYNKVTDLANLSNAKAYVITNARGTWNVQNDATAMTTKKFLPDAASEQFALLQQQGQYFIYSVNAKKFLNPDNTFGSPVPVNISATGNEDYPWFFSFDANHNINVSGTNILIDGWSTIDAGNSNAIIEATDFDSKDAMAALYEYFRLFADGKYYISNVGTGKYLAAGSNWGTHAVVNADGLDYDIKMADGKYTLDSQVSNGGNNHYLNGEWNDGAAMGWIFNEVSEGVYTISNGTNFLTAGENGVVTLAADGTVDAAKWTLKTLEDRIAELAAATAETPVDATFLIQDANFGRNDLRKSAWTMVASNQNLSGGEDNNGSVGNNCAESFHSTFTLSQALTNAPAGKYKMTAQGFYRQDDGKTEDLPTFYANDKTANFPAKTGSENSMTDASKSFSAGEYTIEPIEVTVFENGQLTVGAKGTATNQWVIFDNFRLSYLSSEIPAEEYAPAYNDALAAANAALANEDYAVVTGEEKTALATAINTYSTVDETVEAYKAAISALTAATTAFTGAKGDYDALVAAKAANAERSYAYADADKKAAAEATLTVEATSAADAQEKTAAIWTAFRKYADSHALAEGVEGAINMTDYIVNPNAAEAIAEPWTVVKGEGSGGSLNILDGEPLTDGEGNTYKYFDGGNWGANAWDVALKQTITLPAGKYMITASGRASADVQLSLLVGEEKTAIPAIGATGGLFGRGWNDASKEFELSKKSEVVIGVQGVTTNQYNWMSFTRFRLVCLEKGVEPTTYAISVTPAENGTVEADKATAAEGEEVTVTVTPDEGYMVDEAYWTVGEEKHEFEEPEEGNKASFVMPAADVTITITFKEIPAPGKEYQGLIEQTLTTPDGAVMGSDTGDQTVTITAAGEGKVNITFSGFKFPVMPTTLPKFTIEGVTAVEANGVITYAINDYTLVVEGSGNGQMGGATAMYTVNLLGKQEGAEATPVMMMTLETRVLNTVYFGADADAIAAYKQAVGIKNVKSVQNAGTIYDLSGRKVEKVQRGGIYIINGKKVSMK